MEILRGILTVIFILVCIVLTVIVLKGDSLTENFSLW